MKTAFYERHLSLGAKIVEFSGWEMPVSYKGVIQEHRAVREDAGLFDVSHMGRVVIQGAEAALFLDYLSTNEIAGKKNGTATYTVWCTSEGGSVDDLIIYKVNPEEFHVVLNAGNREKDLEHLNRMSQGWEVAIEPRFQDGIIALQGPRALEILSSYIPEAKKLKPMTFQPVMYRGKDLIISGTGYTGSGGCEVFGPSLPLTELWDALIAEGVEPIGLGARDTLRLEMGYALYGHELSEQIAPTESVSAWTVKMEKKEFLGKDALKLLPHPRKAYGIVLKDAGIAREGYPVYKSGVPIGRVTSGTMSPSLKKAIALVLVEGNLEEGENLEVDIRGRRAAAEVVALPFWRQKR